ncbi:MAG: LuxR C-terminal-related transcriptional regulator [Paludibacteraceae bacterium]
MYKASDKMCDLICGNHESLQVLSRFGLPLGFGDKTVAEVCNAYRVHTPTFLAVVNYKSFPAGCVPCADEVSLDTLMNYLKRAHVYFLDFCLPMIRRKLIEAINCGTENNKIAFLVMRFFDEYALEVKRHMEHEDKHVFAYVARLQKGTRTGDYTIETFARQHRAVDDMHIETKLIELKNIIIKYYPSTVSNELLNSALFDIFTCENDLAQHCQIEDNLFVPAVRLLEQQFPPVIATDDVVADDTPESLSDREKEILVEVVNGLSNKEIAEKLFISVHTVITHRKNISRKLNIHSSAGLTIYAIANKLIDLKALDLG